MESMGENAESIELTGTATAGEPRLRLVVNAEHERPEPLGLGGLPIKAGRRGRLSPEEREARAKAKAEVDAARRKAQVAAARLLKRRQAALVKLGATPEDGGRTGLVYSKKKAAHLLGVSPGSLEAMVEPVDWADNPMYKCAGPVGLYDPIDLFRVSKQQRCHQAKARCTPAKKEAAQRAVATKRKELQAWLDGVTIKFEMPADMTLTKLAEEAINNRNAVSSEYPNGKPRPGFEYYCYEPGCEYEEHVWRWMVNYLRHCASQYEALLAEKAGKVGFPEMYEELKSKIDAAATAYIVGLP
jgi:hypothetical protein